MARFRQTLRRFLRDEDASVAVEAILMLPIMAWAVLGVWVWFDAFRAQSTNIKVAYTVGDILSRELNYITPSYMQSLDNLQAYMTATPENTSLRVTVFHWDTDRAVYGVNWSEGRDGPAALSEAQLNERADRLPVMPDGDVGILVETWVDYRPDFTVGIGGVTFDDFVVTRPRFAGQLCWNSREDRSPDTAVC